MMGFLLINRTSEDQERSASSLQKRSSIESDPQLKASPRSMGTESIEVRGNESEGSAAPTFSDDYRIPSVVRTELQLTAQEVFDLEQELEKIRAVFMARRHERSETVEGGDSREPRFFIPADREFGSSLKSDFLTAASEILGGGARAETFRVRLASDAQFASWGAYETHIEIIDPQTEGKRGPIRAEVRELDPETGKLVRRVSGGLDFITGRYGIKFQVDPSGSDEEGR